MSSERKPYKLLVLTRKIKLPGIVETMSEQVPEVKIAFAEIEEMLAKRLEHSSYDNYQVISHAQNIHNGILVVTFVLKAIPADDDPLAG
jgi:hypothetical protein